MLSPTIGTENQEGHRLGYTGFRQWQRREQDKEVYSHENFITPAKGRRGGGKINIFIPLLLFHWRFLFFLPRIV